VASGERPENRKEEKANAETRRALRDAEKRKDEDKRIRRFAAEGTESQIRIHQRQEENPRADMQRRHVGHPKKTQEKALV